jgi:phosphotransferase system HPr (HPr) family protein
MSASSDAVVVREVVLPADLHARPAGDVTRAAALHDASVRLVVGDREADASSVLAVMGLGATAGQTVSVRGEGAGAQAAVDSVVAALSAARAISH